MPRGLHFREAGMMRYAAEARRVAIASLSYAASDAWLSGGVDGEACLPDARAKVGVAVAVAAREKPGDALEHLFCGC